MNSQITLSWNSYISLLTISEFPSHYDGAVPDLDNACVDDRLPIYAPPPPLYHVYILTISEFPRHYDGAVPDLDNACVDDRLPIYAPPPPCTVSIYSPLASSQAIMTVLTPTLTLRVLTIVCRYTPPPPPPPPPVPCLYTHR